MEESTLSKTQYVNRDELVNAILDSCASTSSLLSEAINEWYMSYPNHNATSFICKYMNENGNPILNSSAEEFMPYVRILLSLNSLQTIEVTKTITTSFKEIKP